MPPIFGYLDLLEMWFIFQNQCKRAQNSAASSPNKKLGEKYYFWPFPIGLPNLSHMESESIQLTDF